MAPCCTGTITPKMIKNGEMKIGDRIQFDEIPVSAPAGKMETPSVEVQTEPVSVPVSVPAASVSEPVSVPAASSEVSKEAAPKEMSKEGPAAAVVQAPMPSRQADWQIQARQQAQQEMAQAQQERQQAQQDRSQSRQSIPTPLDFRQMTPYMDQITITNNGDVPFIAVPQTPLTTENFSETIDITDVQAYLGFLRTQIGRYMRIEQLVGSDTIENRYGFLVGIGTNFIILQEITTGNIMVIDLFSIRLTYIYYSEPVLPRMTPQ